MAAGGVLKGFGITFLILGGILVVAAIGAAGFGGYLAYAEQDKGVFADPDATELAEMLLLGGAVGGGVGIALLILGGVFAAVGGSMARRALLQAVQVAARAPAAVPPHSTRAPWIVAGVCVVAILIALAALGGGSGGGGDGFRALSAAAEQEAPLVGANETYEGRVQGARLPIVGGFNGAAAETVHELSLAPGSYQLQGTLNWTADGPAGASSLTLILEAADGDAWTELARGEGGPGLVVEVSAQELPATVRARVFVGGSGAADQEYSLLLVATGAR